MMKLSTRLGVLVCGICLSGAAFAAQDSGIAGARGRGRSGVDEPTIAPAEIQRMFDAYALLQAQAQLQVTDDQYPRFLARFKALLDVRRRALFEHGRMVAELRRLLMEGQADESQIKDRLQALDDAEARARADAKKALDALDQILDVRQQARLRVFDEQMERRKLELVTRARLANRPKRQP
ncbi:MAG: hypothetical protein ABUS56_12705 [Acidobacteriota bacterium]